MTLLTITDQVEREVPLDQRPSWKFSQRRRRINVVKAHARMYPSSRIRAVYRGSLIAGGVLLIGPFLLAVIRGLVGRT